MKAMFEPGQFDLEGKKGEHDHAVGKDPRYLLN